ncbi:Translation initiation factor IF2/IF5 [Corchorus olitorius]|uniref:Translation initiation factor IF2/IF5 n=1 Tax=Corchorus olitorius TaxID=93759 RepID=A0A1R3IQM3_9ROSI|nr:Translation initiation factor IF2/IF5 [Corchorus olitorius]
MALQNIGASNSDDAFYRYKMPKMITKIEGRGNGIKTNVVNMVDIAKALARPASYTTKYFGCELGAQSKFDEKTGTSLVNGAHDTAKLAGLLENFIKKYVQCYGCGNPETEIVITKTQMLTLKCAACGFISDVDMRDKLTTFILKNPPEAKKSAKDKKAMRRAEKERLKEGEAADEELKKIKKEAKKKGTSTASKDAASKGATTKKKDTSLEAAKQRIQEQLSAVTADMVMLSTDEEEKKKTAKKSPEREVKVHGNGVSAHEKLLHEIKEHLNKGSSASQLKSFLGSLSGTPQEVMDALFEALFHDVGKGFAKEVGKKKNYLAAATQEEGWETVLLHSIESFCGKARPDAAKEVALVLKVLYDNDILEEELIMEWYQKGLAGSNKSSPIWKNIKPFIEWLQNAESESEEE